MMFNLIFSDFPFRLIDTMILFKENLDLVNW